MFFRKFKDEQEASFFVMQEMVNAIKNKPTINLGLATGSTPILLYKELGDRKSVV